jgi:prephenate dehydrogenase
MQTVVIIGTGLIGGSFALALKRAGFHGKIIGVSSPATIQVARERGVIDEALALEDALPQADLVYLAQPISRILDTLGKLDPLLRPGCLVTDAGSTKWLIVETARRNIRRAQFLGGHPMAGKEKRGVEAAEANLFEGRTYVLTPREPSELETPAAISFLRWIHRIGAVPMVLAPAEHDRVVAYTSHLPQLASTTLAAMLAEQITDSEHRKVAGPGLADMTRLALSPHSIWLDILRTNMGEIDKALSCYIQRLEQMRKSLKDEGEIRQEFEAAASLASSLPR